jgi:adenylate kinase
MRLILFGAPGSGKGTQADMLASQFNLEKISLGDILRKEVGKGSSLGVEVKQYMDKGELVADDTVRGVIAANLTDDNFILDGYPRNRKQAETLEGILEEKNCSIDAFIYLDVSQATIVDRLSKRRVCPKCGTIYHLDSMPPKEDNLCDQCGAGLGQRDDDNPETIKKRWNVFLENSKEIFDFYKQKGLFVSVDGGKPKEEVLEEIRDKLQNKKILT